MKIVWLPKAQRDLSQISGYLEEEASRAAANRILKRIVHSATLLMHDPWLGHPSESTDGVHELQVAKLPYCLPYRVIEDRVEILRVFHQARERPEEWG